MKNKMKHITTYWERGVVGVEFEEEEERRKNITVSEKSYENLMKALNKR